MLGLAITTGSGLNGAELGFVTASSVHSGDFQAAFAVDGNPNTRWASGGSQAGEHLQIDLGCVTAVGQMRINWEAAFARDYSLWEISLDGVEGGQALRDQWQHFDRVERKAAEEHARALRATLVQSGVREIVYAVRPPYPDGHWYASIGYFADDAARKAYAVGGGLSLLDVESGTVRALIDDPAGTVRDPAVDYDGDRILFSYRQGGTDTFHLFTIRRDGSDLTQLTSGEYDDIEPAWLPDGGIVFVSSRCRRWVNCWLTQVATIHRCDADGGNVRPLSANVEHDNTPWPLPDGRVLYTRWEYVDRSQVDYHHLWTMNPDGTGQAVFFGNQHPPGLYIDAKPISGTNEILFINSPGHGQREHAGHVALVETRQGPDHLPALRNLTGGGYRDPYPITPELFLVAQGRNLVLLDREGTTGVIHQLDMTLDGRELHEPRPVRSRAREPVRSTDAHSNSDTGRLVLANAYLGRNMTGVAPGDIAKLLVVESLPKPINYTGGMDPLSYGGTFTLERVLGTVPVEADGSAHFEVPANRSLFVIALDRHDNSVKRMQSFFSVMPGETLSCVGCHESRVQAPANSPDSLAALRRSPSPIQPIHGIPEVFDFPRDIQPILDRHCVACHDYTSHAEGKEGPRAGKVILTGDRGPLFSHSYVTLTVCGQIADGRNRATSNYAPRTLGAVASPLMHKVQDGHYGVKLSAHEIALLRYWIETGAPYPGTYGALGAGAIGGYFANEQLLEADFEWPTTRAAVTVMAARCQTCHQGAMQLPQSLSDENGLSFWRPEWDDPRLKRSRHLVFNLSRPELSLMLLAPLAKEAGGYGLCRSSAVRDADVPVFADRTDEGCQAILTMISEGKRRLETVKRFDMAGYRPPEPFLREMVRYGILSAHPAPETPVDPYALDRAYWQSFQVEVADEYSEEAMDERWP